MAGSPVTPQSRLWFAVLATNGVLRSQAAAYVFGMCEELPEIIGVYLQFTSASLKLPGVTCTRYNLSARERTSRGGLPITTRAIAVLDCLTEFPLSQAVQFADRARAKGWVSTKDVQQRLACQRYGNTQLREVWEVVSTGGESTAERLLLRLLRDAGITGWKAGYRVVVDGRLVAKVDVAFPAVGLAIEVDGFAYHSSSGRFQYDRERQNRLTALGWRVLRFTWADLNDRPDYVLIQIQTFLSEMVVYDHFAQESLPPKILS